MAYKTREVKTTLYNAINMAFSEFDALAGEMRETADNMENANMGHMEKCVRASDAADELENHVGEPFVPEEIREIEVVTSEQVNKDKRKGASRAVRLVNALTFVQASIDTLENLKTDAVDETARNADPVQEAVASGLNDKISVLIDDLQDHADFDVDFPGMFG